jgi:hypothetical protein
MSSSVTARLSDRHAAPRRHAWWYLTVALLAAFGTAFAVSLAGFGADRAASAPASSGLGVAPPVAVPLRPTRLRQVAPMPRLRATVPSRTPAPARPAPAVAPTVTAEPTPTQETIPAAPTAAPAPPPAPTRTSPRRQPETPNIGQGFDSSG